MALPALTQYVIENNKINALRNIRDSVLLKLSIVAATTVYFIESEPGASTRIASLDVGTKLYKSDGTEVSLTHGSAVTWTPTLQAGDYYFEVPASATDYDFVIRSGTPVNDMAISTLTSLIISPAPAPAPNPTTTTTTTTTTPAPTTTTQTAPTPTDAQIAADKLTVASLKNRVKAGDTLIDDEAIMMKVGDSALVTQIMTALDAGGGYDALRLLGLSDSLSVDVLGMYSMKPDAIRYEREIGVDAIMQTKTRLKDFLNYLDANSIAYPNLSGFFSAVRSNNTIYEAMRQWNKVRTA